MEIIQIENLLQECNFDELQAVENIVEDMIHSIEPQIASEIPALAKEQRAEKRFQSNSLATISRTIDVKPGERRTYTANILDLSRSGMRLKVDTNFIPSRLLEITFAAPGGKMKRSFLEIVRLRKMADPDNTWLEVGCRGMDPEKVRRLQMQDERIARMRSKLHTKWGLLLLVVGPDCDAVNFVTTRIKRAGFQAQHLSTVHQAMLRAEKLSAQLVIFAQGRDLCNNSEMLEEALAGPRSITTMAIVENHEQRFSLYHAGIDECLLQADCDHFLFQAIERSLLSHASRYDCTHSNDTAQTLLISNDSPTINLVGFRLEENHLDFKVLSTCEKAIEFAGSNLKVIFRTVRPPPTRRF